MDDLRSQSTRTGLTRWIAICVLGTFVLTVVSGPWLRPANSNPRDAFDWWAEIILPSLVGAATIVVSLVALIASSRATRLGRQVERQRDMAEIARAEEERGRYLRGMAVTEARTLTAWAFIAVNDRNWDYRKLEEVGTERHGRTLQQRARVELSQSLVPGAQELLELTEKEIEYFHVMVPYAGLMPDVVVSGEQYPDPASELLSQAVPEYRRSRMFERIRAWARDPEKSLVAIQTEARYASANIDDHMDYRRGLGVKGLKPLHDLPQPVSWVDEQRLLVDLGLVDDEGHG